jgi:hypothetical protein
MNKMLPEAGVHVLPHIPWQLYIITNHPTRWALPPRQPRTEWQTSRCSIPTEISPLSTRSHSRGHFYQLMPSGPRDTHSGNVLPIYLHLPRQLHINIGMLKPRKSKIRYLKNAVEACINIIRIDTLIKLDPDRREDDGQGR